MKRLRAFALFAVACLSLSGCITLLPEAPPPARLYVLEAGDTQPIDAPALDAVIGVAAPSGPRALLGADLIWRDGGELTFVGQSQWSSRADTALQSMLMESLIRQGRFRAVTRIAEARSDFDLRWEVLDFQIDGASMKARFTAEATLLASPGRRVVAQTIVSAEATVAARTSSAAAAALADAARDGSTQIGAFAAEQAAQASAASISR
jgi:cholesterol transport system auxiliary component